MRNLKKEVCYVLEHYPETRNSDIDLTIKIWEVFHKEKFAKILKENINESPFEKMRKVMLALPREDNVKRIRAKYQNEEKRFLPTSEAIARQRKFNIAEWKELLGYKQGTIW